MSKFLIGDVYNKVKDLWLTNRRKSIQEFEISISSGASDTATISAVNTGNYDLRHSGGRASSAIVNIINGTLELTDSTTITATLGTSVTGTTVIRGQITDYYGSL